MSRILIVDDMPAGRDALARALQREGYETEVARNGAEGLVRLKKNKPDLILLDHMMPEVDGLTFLSGIRRFPKYKDLPVIMFTGMQDRANAMKAQSLGVKDYVLKAQYSLQDLLDLIQKHVRPQPQPLPAGQ